MVTQSTRLSYTEAVFSIVKKIYERTLDDLVSDLDVNEAIWGIFLNTTLKAAVHLGQDYAATLRFVKKHLWNSVGQLCGIDGELIEFGGKYFPGPTSLEILEKIQSLMRDLQCELEHFKDRIICVNVQRHCMWRKRKYRKMTVAEHARKFSRSLVFLGAWIRKEMVRNLH